MLDRQQALRKKGSLTDGEIKSLVKEWHDTRTEAELNSDTVKMEMTAMAKKLSRYNVERLGKFAYRKGRRNDESAGQPNGRVRINGN